MHFPAYAFQGVRESTCFYQNKSKNVKNSQKSYAQEQHTTVTFPSIPFPGELNLFQGSFTCCTRDKFGISFFLFFLKSSMTRKFQYYQKDYIMKDFLNFKCIFQILFFKVSNFQALKESRFCHGIGKRQQRLPQRRNCN